MVFHSWGEVAHDNAGAAHGFVSDASSMQRTASDEDGIKVDLCFSHLHIWLGRVRVYVAVGHCRAQLCELGGAGTAYDGSWVARVTTFEVVGACLA